jgi:hypothetical protein
MSTFPDVWDQLKIDVSNNCINNVSHLHVDIKVMELDMSTQRLKNGTIPKTLRICPLTVRLWSPLKETIDEQKPLEVAHLWNIEVVNVTYVVDPQVSLLSGIWQTNSETMRGNVNFKNCTCKFAGLK